MAVIQLVELEFMGPVHFGDNRSDYGHSEATYHSDSLYAAMISALACAGAQIPGSGDLGFVISSLFPFTTWNDHKVRFFPKPFVHFTMNEEGIEQKSLKKVIWLDQSYFEKLLNKENCGDFNGGAHLQGSFLSQYLLPSNFIFSQVRPRVQVPRTEEENDGETNIFYTDQLFFSKGSGMYFLFEGDSAPLIRALNILKDSGLGTDRSVGMGHFNYRLDQIDLKLPENSGFATNLSLYCPKNQEELTAFLNEESRYELLSRGGWTSSESSWGLRKKNVYMFKEGSVMGANIAGHQSHGRSDLDLRPPEAEGIRIPDHPIYRNGKALFVPIKL